METGDIVQTNKIMQTILIVDDEVINRRILVKMLSSGFHVLEAENGQRAWEIVEDREQEIAAVLLDIVMPVMDGYGFLDKIRESGRKDLPILVMTGESGSEAEQKALDAGAWDFVTKPYKPRILLTRLKNAIARSQMAMYEQMRYMSEHDALTGLHNRARMYADTKRMLMEHPDHRFIFLRVDIDHFALFNASFGEAEGNRLVCYLADIVREETKVSELCTYGRMNADIFTICIDDRGDTTLLQEAVNRAEALLRDYRVDYSLDLSVGGCYMDDPSLHVEEYYIRASMAAQKCKNQYEKNLNFYDNSLGERASEEIEISKEMQTALDEKQFIVYLQPKFTVSTDTICGAEALVRWRHPVKGLISPGKFIPVFERNGFIAKVDYYVWEETCRMLKKWVDSGRAVYPVSVNISRISMYNPNLVRLLGELVEKYEISASLLQLEVTESAYMSNTELMEKTIRELRESGFTILMDDFGSGYSSLNTLKSIRVDVLKIDMKFLPEGNEMERGEIILASIIQMANWLGMTVIVEGVETRRQRDFLEGVGCDSIQGYFYSRPVPQEEYEEKYIYNEIETERPVNTQEIVPKHNVTILVIDDDEADRAIINEYFQEEYHVQQARSAEEGLVYLRQNSNKIRLVLVDNIMDGMSGLDFLKLCHSEQDFVSMPIIMITANESSKDQVEAFQAGAYDYITKPLVREVVLARVQHVMDVSSQISSYQRVESDYRHQAEIDAATGLLNKKTFREIAKRVMRENPSDCRAMMIVDVDDFKKLNDNYGRLKGDEVLAMMAASLKKSFRRMDIIGRFGGDEFIVLMSSLSDREIARRKADEITKNIVVSCAQKHIAISISIGIALCDAKDTFDTLFARADQALYGAKSTGKGKAVVYGEIVPPIMDDNKPVAVICGEDPQIYPSIALAYGSSVAFTQVTSFEGLKKVFADYRERVCVICMDTQKRVMEDSGEFYDYILSQGGGTRIPIVAVCREGDMENVRGALELKITDILTLPPQMDVIQRRLSRVIMESTGAKQ